MAATVRVENPTGAISIHAVMGVERVEWTATCASRPLRPGDIQSTSSGPKTLIRVHPADGVRVDVQLTVPHSAQVEAAVKSGDLSLEGLLYSATLMSDQGNVRVRVPWALTRLVALAEKAPRRLVTPKVHSMTFVTGKLDQRWAMANTRPDVQERYGHPLSPGGWNGVWERVYGLVRIAATTPGTFELEDMTLPADSRVQFPEFARILLDQRRSRPRRAAPAVSAVDSPGTVPTAPSEAGPVFSSSVRLVTFAVPVHDRDGHPVPGLKAEDFELVEDGNPQPLAWVRSEEAPFHLVLLLDQSLSEYINRDTIRDAARNFVAITRPQDQVAIHSLANGMFLVVSPLSGDHAKLEEAIVGLPGVFGGSPIYDSIALSYFSEKLGSLEDRTAIVVLSDGMDNQLEAPGRGSEIPFKELRRAAEEWPTLIYPILLPYFDPNDRQKRARENFQKLADASGGRFFEAVSIDDLKPVYARVAEELRSVYTLGYYPSNRDFNGAFRKVLVRVKRSGLILRVRPGYYAN